jgi:hypothetical protein
LFGSTEASTLISATSLAAPDDEASDKELAIEASSKGPFGASPTMSMIGNPSPSIAKANISWIFNQVNDNEDELARANVGVVCK